MERLPKASPERGDGTKRRRVPRRIGSATRHKAARDAQRGVPYMKTQRIWPLRQKFPLAKQTNLCYTNLPTHFP